MKRIEKIGYTILMVIFCSSLLIGITDPVYFDLVYTRENGIIETATAISLFLVGALCFSRYTQASFKKPVLWKVATIGFGLLFFFAAGEEISWGQHIFNWEPGYFFTRNNAQLETNLHNLKIGNTKINKLIFTQLLFAVMLIYLFVVPILYKHVRKFRNFIHTCAIPVVRWHHTLAFIIATVVVLIIPADRKWEVYELAFAIIFFLIFSNPYNSIIYAKTRF